MKIHLSNINEIYENSIPIDALICAVEGTDAVISSVTEAEDGTGALILETVAHISKTPHPTKMGEY